MLEIDGASGGGSILRIASALAIAEQIPIKIINIRKQRKSPGLKHQHLAGIELLARMTGSDLSGSKIGSQTITINPNDDLKEYDQVNLFTAASVSLIFQIMSNYVMASGNSLTFDFNGGGTHTKWSPNFDYLQEVTGFALAKFGQNITVDVDKAGFYPKGGANGRIQIKQHDWTRVNLDHTLDYNSKVISIASEELTNADVARRQVKGVYSCDISSGETISQYVYTESIGTSVTAVAKAESMVKGGSALGERGLPAEVVGKKAGTKLEEALRQPVAVDKYLADQLLVALAYAKVGSSYTFGELTDHIKVNLEVIKKILGKRIDLEKHEKHYTVTRV